MIFTIKSDDREYSVETDHLLHVDAVNIPDSNALFQLEVFTGHIGSERFHFKDKDIRDRYVRRLVRAMTKKPRPVFVQEPAWRDKMALEFAKHIYRMWPDQQRIDRAAIAKATYEMADAMIAEGKK